MDCSCYLGDQMLSLIVMCLLVSLKQQTLQISIIDLWHNLVDIGHRLSVCILMIKMKSSLPQYD